VIVDGRECVALAGVLFFWVNRGIISGRDMAGRCDDCWSSTTTPNQNYFALHCTVLHCIVLHSNIRRHFLNARQVGAWRRAYKVLYSTIQDGDMSIHVSSPPYQSRINEK
jgi:hypothetical protein